MAIAALTNTTSPSGQHGNPQLQALERQKQQLMDQRQKTQVSDDDPLSKQEKIKTLTEQISQLDAQIQQLTAEDRQKQTEPAQKETPTLRKKELFTHEGVAVSDSLTQLMTLQKNMTDLHQLQSRLTGEIAVSSSEIANSLRTGGSIKYQSEAMMKAAGGLGRVEAKLGKLSQDISKNIAADSAASRKPDDDETPTDAEADSAADSPENSGDKDASKKRHPIDLLV